MKSNPLLFMGSVYFTVFPEVQKNLSYWRTYADKIPNDELRQQAIASIESKQFHCEGGSILSLLAPTHLQKEVIAFIVAYQTISDYLDNLC
ncbi:MAG: DUF2600 family protein, partial [Bacilli bacterium]